MARNSFNFQAVLKLRTDDFRKGVKDVQKSLNGLKQTFLSFAGGLGLTLGLDKLVSSLKETSVKIDTAKNVLKNVSETTIEYAENLNFLRDISDKYGQDLIVLVNNFGQFRAAAKSSKLEIDDLRKIYESLTRAAGAYHMSADRTNDMMIAVTQMFSKGKIAAEELRRQLGNSLPGAFNLMAKAAGVAGITANGTTAELEDMMRKGKVLADDVMPTFAAILDEVTAKSSFDSLQQSLNRLKNSWTAFVEEAEFDKLYEKMIGAASGVLGFLARNMETVKASLLGLAAGFTAVFGQKIWKRGQKSIDEWKNATASALDATIDNVEYTEKALDKLLKKEITLENHRRKSQSGDWFQKTATGAHYTPRPEFETKNGVTVIKNLPSNYRDAAAAALDYNKALLAQNELYKNIGRSALLTKKEVKQLSKENLVYTQIIATQGQVYVNSLSKIDVLAKKVGAGLKSFLANNWLFLAVSVITTIAAKVSAMVKHTRELKNLTENTVNATKTNLSAESERIGKLQQIKRILQEEERGTAEWNGALNAANDLMGLVGDKELTAKSNIEDIVSACDEWLVKLKKVAYQESVIAKIQELAAENITLQGDIDRLKTDKHYNETRTVTKIKGGAGADAQDYEAYTPRALKINADIDDKLSRIESNTKSIDKLLNLEAPLDNPEMNGPNPRLMDEEAIRRALGIRDKKDEDKKGGGGDDIEAIKKIVDNYKKKLGELNNQFEHGAVSLEDYQKEYDKLITDTFKSLAGFKDTDIAEAGQRGFYKTLETLFKGVGENIDDKEIEKAAKALGEKITDDIKRGLDKTTQQRMNGRKAEDLFREANALTPKKRDTAFDYRKTGKRGQADIANETYENQKDYLERLRELYNQLAALGQLGTEQMDKLAQKIGEAAQNTTNFRDAAKLAEWKADIEELSKAYNDKLYSSIRDVASSVERLYNVYKDFAEVFGAEIDPDGNFQKILTIFGALFETFETIYTVVKSLNELQTAQAALEKAKNDAQMKALEQEIGLQAALGTTKVTASEAATVAALGEAAAVKTLAEATKEAAAAAAVANAMQVPYPANLAALASNIGAATSAYAMMRGLTAFAKGGVVGAGPKTGDHTLIRANRGELVLNGKQQSTLFDILNGKKGLNGGGQVDFRIKGSDLVGTLNNYNNKRKG